MEELYDKENKSTEEEMNVVKTEDVDNIGPNIMYNEFEKALYELKNGKSEGIDNISAELVKALGSKGKHEMFEICKQIYNQGEWPEDFMKSIVIPIEKKSGAKECVDFRTISLVTHASKIVLKMMQQRLKFKQKHS